MDLSAKKCKPCEGGVDPFTRERIDKYLSLVKEWQVNDDKKSISKLFKFKDFKEALAFVNQVGEIAEAEGHHPDIELGWGRVKISLTTHAIKGLSENDFILAYKIDSKTKA
jgi:4a-hydroxytetrahydrobiopterin dehydratase